MWGAARKVEIEALGDHVEFLGRRGRMFVKMKFCIDGRFVYAMGHNPLKSGHVRTDAYIDGPGRLGARFRAKGSQ